MREGILGTKGHTCVEDSRESGAEEQEEQERQMPDTEGGRRMEAKTNENTNQAEYSQRDTKTKETRKRNEDCYRIISRNRGRN